jgi:putative oxidoreductase
MSSPSQGRLQSLYRFQDSLFTPLAHLAARLVFGQGFLIAGLGKWQDIDKVVGFFENLGIPAASVQAPFVATVELVGGILLILGLGTRISALLLTCTMVVAALTAHLGDFAGTLTLDTNLSKIAPLPFLVAMLWLAAKGAGKLSVDHLLAVRSARG